VSESARQRRAREIGLAFLLAVRVLAGSRLVPVARAPGAARAGVWRAPLRFRPSLPAAHPSQSPQLWFAPAPTAAARRVVCGACGSSACAVAPGANALVGPIRRRVVVDRNLNFPSVVLRGTGRQRGVQPRHCVVARDDHLRRCKAVRTAKCEQQALSKNLESGTGHYRH